MKRVNEQNLVVLFLLLGPFLDVASFLGSSLSIIIRGFFLVSITALLIVQKKELKSLVLLLIFGVISFIYQYIYLKTGIMASASSVLKFMYLPVSIIYFKSYVFPFEKDKVLEIILASYIGIYLLSYIFQFGANAYLETDGKSGFKGVFSSINEFSAILVCLLPIVSTYLKEKKKNLLLGILLISVLFCSLLTGTKILLGGLVFCILYLLWQEREKLFLKQKKSVKIAILVGTIFLLIIGGFLFTQTRTYQNMMVQQDFFKVERVFSLEFLNKIIYNNRLTFLKENITYLQSQNLLSWLFGIGIQNSIKLVEIDIFDVWIRYGIIGLLIFTGIGLQSIQWKTFKEQEKLALMLLILVSLTSGHVFIYPAVSIYWGVICCQSKKDQNTAIVK